MEISIDDRTRKIYGSHDGRNYTWADDTWEPCLNLPVGRRPLTPRLWGKLHDNFKKYLGVDD